MLKADPEGDKRMKIESKHGTKKPSYAAVATMLAATTLVTGCGVQYAGGLTESTPYSSELQYEGEPTEYTPETIAVPSREYFENVERNYSVDDIIREIGGYDEWDASKNPVGFIWHLENGQKAVVHNGKDNELDSIIITSGSTEEIIYIRQSGPEPTEVIKSFFEAFKTSDFEAMKPYCTEYLILSDFSGDNVSGIRKAEFLECDNGEYASYGDSYTFNVTISLVASEDPENTEMKTNTVCVILTRDEEFNWKINEISVPRDI